MNPELNQEYPEPGETELIERMVKLAVARMEPRQDHMRRGQHAKSTGCVRAVFTIRDDVPDRLRHGVFREPGKTYQSIVRFSNSQETIELDGKGTARGMAIRLLNVEGAPAVPGTGDRCQDFLMVDHPVFPIPTPAEYVKLFDLRDTPLVGGPLAGAWLALFHHRHLEILEAIRGKVVASPLELTYWSGSPYRLGPPGTADGNTVKYSVVPHSEGTKPPSDPDADYLSQALKRHLKAKEAVFDFRVQLQTDPVAMPVEDVSIEWDERVSEPIQLATLAIGVQDVDSPVGQDLCRQCEAVTFSPWNALAEHRPMGGINRLRRAVYLASQATRAAEGAF